jgi:hypothetical protein
VRMRNAFTPISTGGCRRRCASVLTSCWALPRVKAIVRRLKRSQAARRVAFCRAWTSPGRDRPAPRSTDPRRCRLRPCVCRPLERYFVTVPLKNRYAPPHLPLLWVKNTQRLIPPKRRWTRRHRRHSQYLEHMAPSWSRRVKFRRSSGVVSILGRPRFPSRPPSDPVQNTCS